MPTDEEDKSQDQDGDRADPAVDSGALKSSVFRQQRRCARALACRATGWQVVVGGQWPPPQRAQLEPLRFARIDSKRQDLYRRPTCT